MLITQTGNKGHSCMRQSSLARVEIAAAWLTKRYSLPLSILWVGASKNLQLESKICQNYGPDTQASTEPREINSNRVNTVNVTKHLQWHRHRSAKLIWETNLDHQMGNLMQLLCRIRPTDHVCALCNLPVCPYRGKNKILNRWTQNRCTQRTFKTISMKKANYK